MEREGQSGGVLGGPGDLVEGPQKLGLRASGLYGLGSTCRPRDLASQ